MNSIAATASSPVTSPERTVAATTTEPGAVLRFAVGGRPPAGVFNGTLVREPASGRVLFEAPGLKVVLPPAVAAHRLVTLGGSAVASTPGPIPAVLRIPATRDHHGAQVQLHLQHRHKGDGDNASPAINAPRAPTPPPSATDARRTTTSLAVQSADASGSPTPKRTATRPAAAATAADPAATSILRAGTAQPASRAVTPPAAKSTDTGDRLRTATEPSGVVPTRSTMAAPAPSVPSSPGPAGPNAGSTDSPRSQLAETTAGLGRSAPTSVPSAASKIAPSPMPTASSSAPPPASVPGSAAPTDAARASHPVPPATADARAEHGAERTPIATDRAPPLRRGILPTHPGAQPSAEARVAGGSGSPTAASPTTTSLSSSGSVLARASAPATSVEAHPATRLPAPTTTVARNERPVDPPFPHRIPTAVPTRTAAAGHRPAPLTFAPPPIDAQAPRPELARAVGDLVKLAGLTAEPGAAPRSLSLLAAPSAGPDAGTLQLAGVAAPLAHVAADVVLAVGDDEAVAGADALPRRLVLELDLPHLGRVRLDGLAHGGRFDVVLSQVPTALEPGLRALWSLTAQRLGLDGHLQLQPRPVDPE